jgi:hypothetical protein
MLCNLLHIHADSPSSAKNWDTRELTIRRSYFHHDNSAQRKGPKLRLNIDWKAIGDGCSAKVNTAGPLVLNGILDSLYIMYRSTSYHWPSPRRRPLENSSTYNSSPQEASPWPIWNSNTPAYKRTMKVAKIGNNVVVLNGSKPFSSCGRRL